MGDHSLPGSLEDVGASEIQPLDPQKYKGIFTLPLQVLRKHVSFSDQKISFYIYLTSLCSIACVAFTVVAYLEREESRYWFTISLAMLSISLYFALVFFIKCLHERLILKTYKNAIKIIAPPEQDKLTVHSFWGRIRNLTSPIQEMLEDILDIIVPEQEEHVAEEEPLVHQVAVGNVRE